MSLRMVSLWIVGALLVAATLKADPPQGEPAKVANQVKDKPVMPKPVPVASADKRPIQFDVKVWDVDHAALRAIMKTDVGVHEFYKANGLIVQPDWISAAIGNAIGDLLSPHGSKRAVTAPLPTRAFAVQRNSVSKKLLGHDISSAFKTIAEPTLVATNGREASLLCGGEVPIVVPQSGGSTEIVFLEFGLKLKILPRLIDKGRITLGLDFENSELDTKSEGGESGIRLITSQGFRLSAQMKLGEQLLVAQQTGKQDVTRLVQIQPTLFVEHQAADKPQDAKPATVSKSGSQPPHEELWPTPPTPGQSSPAAKEITVEDRWPIDDVKVGDEVIPVFVFMNRNRTGVGVLSPANVRKLRLRVVAISKSQRGEGLSVTLRPHMAADSNGILEEFQERAGLAMTCCLLRTSGRGFNQKAALRDVLETLPASIGLVPVELAVEGVWRIPADEDIEILHADDHYDIEKVDGRYPEWPRLIAKKPGLGRLIFAQGDSYLALTEILVKADTRELELHIRQQFPMSKVSITSLGTNSLLLTGSADSDEDSHGIVDLAQQFAPKVLNRLKVGGPGRDSTWSTTRTVRPTGGPVVIDELPPGYPDGIRVQQIPRETQFTDSPRPTTIAPSDPLPGVIAPAAAKEKGSKKSAELEQLRNEIRELRQDVRELIQRLDREPIATLKNKDDAKPAIKLGRNDLEFNKLILEYNELMEQQRFAEAEVIAKQAVELDPNNPLSQTMTFKAAIARRVADNEKQRPATTAPAKTSPKVGEPWLPAPLAHESVIDNAWRMLGLRLAPLTESERKQVLSKYQGGLKVTEVRYDSPASQNNIRKDDILVGLHVWEITNFDNLQFVLGHPHIAQHGTLKFYVVRGSDTLFGELKIVTPALPMPSNTRTAPAPHSRSIALADLPMKLATDLDKLKLHLEVHRAIVEMAAESRGISVTDDEVRQHLQVQSDRDQMPAALLLQALKTLPQGQQFFEATRQQLALVRLSGKSSEPTDAELQDAYRLAQSGYIDRRRFAFTDRNRAIDFAREFQANPKQFAELGQKNFVTETYGARLLVPTVPPQPADEVVAKLQEGEVSEVIQEAEQFVIYQRLRVIQPEGTFDDLKQRLRAALIINKTNDIALRQIEQLRQAYRLIVVPAHDPPRLAEPTAAVPTRTPYDRRWPLQFEGDSPSTPTAGNLAPLPPQPETIGVTESSR